MKVLIDRAIVEQALEALEYENSWHESFKVRPYASTIDSITALRAALAESGRDWSLLEATQESLREHMAEIQILRAALAQQNERVEPVAWRFKPMIGSPWSLSDDGYYISCKRDQGYIVEALGVIPTKAN